MQINYKSQNIVVLSDTHDRHRMLPYLPADIVIHLGDACSDGNDEQLKDFFEWYAQYPAKHKIFIAGNHELQWELEPEKFLKMRPKNIRFLENEIFTIDGIYIMALPARPWLHGIPEIKPTKNIDFLITHAPPKGVLDKGWGCNILKDYTLKLQPKFHFFGHVHETGNQFLQLETTTFYNVSNYHQLWQ